MTKPDKKLVKVKVAKRRSIDIGGVVQGPGVILELPMDEARDLYDKGFVVDPDEDAASAAEGSGQQVEIPEQ